MVACARFLGRDIKTCTRGAENCLCEKENRMVTDTEFNYLLKEHEKAKDLLRQIGYPKRGTDEEKMDIYDASRLIQSNFSIDDLEDL